jgi:predicted CXXCH cytochrome family protein
VKKRLVVLSVAALVIGAGGYTGASAETTAAKGTVDPDTGKQCYQCHRSKVKGPVLHEALASMECTPCHKVSKGDHQTDRSLFTVKDTSPNLCWECHDKPTNAKSTHGAIDEEGCTGCHSPHSADLKYLLDDNPPELCFDCHGSKFVKQQQSSSVTGFRDGEQNLHYVHAGKNKIECLACHDVHASPQDHLIRPKGSNGKEAVTITYAASGKGGNCTTSCHDQMSYERK